MTSPTSDRRSAPFQYRDLDGEPAEGVVWCPGPAAASVWVLPEAGARAADAVVVKLAKRRKGGGFDGEHRQVRNWARPPSANGCDELFRPEPYEAHYDYITRLDHRYAPALSEAYWRDVVGPVEQLALGVPA